MNPRLIVLSDLHIAPPGPLCAFQSGHSLAALLRDQARPGTTIVLAGDIFDLLHVEQHPGVLDMPGAPGFLRRTLGAIKTMDWGRDVFQAIAALINAGGRCIMMPGNHDPELHHPDARSILLEALELSDHPDFVLHRDDDPLPFQIGNNHVIVGHGHRVDKWNDIDPGAVRRAMETGRRDIELPPGSRLVREVLLPFKHARNAKTGKPRFPFVDLLKPELPAVPLLLLYFDPVMCMNLLGKALGVVQARLLRRFARHLRPGPVLGDGAKMEPPTNLDELLADALAQELTERERHAPSATQDKLETFLEGHSAPRPGMLANHSTWLAPVRAALRLISHNNTFFNEKVLSSDDEAIVDKQLRPQKEPCVGIFGHTHAARHVTHGKHMYVNTGTWMGLMDLPRFDDDNAVRSWVDKLEAGDVPRIERHTYAEVTEQGVKLHGL